MKGAKVNQAVERKLKKRRRKRQAQKELRRRDRGRGGTTRWGFWVLNNGKEGR